MTSFLVRLLIIVIALCLDGAAIGMWEQYLTQPAAVTVVVQR